MLEISLHLLRGDICPRKESDCFRVQWLIPCVMAVVIMLRVPWLPRAIFNWYNWWVLWFITESEVQESTWLNVGELATEWADIRLAIESFVLVACVKLFMRYICFTDSFEPWYWVEGFFVCCPVHLVKLGCWPFSDLQMVFFNSDECRAVCNIGDRFDVMVELLYKMDASSEGGL